MKKKSLIAIGWFSLRFLFLNFLLILAIIILSLARVFIEPSSDIIELKFPFALYFVSLILTNLVYVMGNVFEVIHLKLWNKQINPNEFESKFFKAGLLVILIVNMAGVILYTLDR